MIRQTSGSLKQDNRGQLREAANLVGKGIVFQEHSDYSNAKPMIQQGIDKIKKVLIKDNSTDKEIIFEYYSLFEKFLQNVNNDEENEKIVNESKTNGNYNEANKYTEGNSIKDMYQNFMSKRNNEESEFLFLPIKILQKLGDSIEMGTHFSSNFYLRKEIWNQNNAKIDGLHQKYEAYKAIFEKIDNLMILSKNNVINIENIEKFCDMIIDIHNNFSKEFNFIKPCKYSLKNDPGQTGFYKRFSDISTKIKNNLLSTKLLSKPDYLDNLLKMVKKTRDLETIFTNKNFKKEDADMLRERKIQISMFFYHTVFKLTLQDVRDLTLRFLKKKIISFENK